MDKQACQNAYQQLTAYICSNHKHVIDLPNFSKAFQLAAAHAAKSAPSQWDALHKGLCIAKALAQIPCPSAPLLCAVLLYSPRNIADTLQQDALHDILSVYDTVKSDPAQLPFQASKHFYWAVHLLCAEAVHELRTAADVPARTLRYVQNTLIPIARYMKMRYYVLLLSDLCCKKEHNDPDMECIQALTCVSADAYKRFDNLLQQALDTQHRFTGFTSDCMKDLGACHENPFRRALLPYEISKQLCDHSTFERSLLDLWEVLLTYDGECEAQMLRDYIAFHREYLDCDLTMQYMGKEEHCITFRLIDHLENNYLVKLIPKSKVYAYLFGDGTQPLHYLSDAPKVRDHTTITVYTCSASGEYHRHHKLLPAGATVLDLAFHVSPSAAIMVHSAKIHPWNDKNPPNFTDSDDLYPLHTVLRENDVVFFMFDTPAENAMPIPQANIDWFSAIQTQYAKKCLIQYLKETRA